MMGPGFGDNIAKGLIGAICLLVFGAIIVWETGKWMLVWLLSHLHVEWIP